MTIGNKDNVVSALLTCAHALNDEGCHQAARLLSGWALSLRQDHNTAVTHAQVLGVTGIVVAQLDDMLYLVNRNTIQERADEPAMLVETLGAGKRSVEPELLTQEMALELRDIKNTIYKQRGMQCHASITTPRG